MRGILEGIRVLALVHGYAGPYCAMLLGFLGAEVIKVESRRRIDLIRFDPFDPHPRGMDNLRFNSLNLNCRSITLNLAHPKSIPLFVKLIEKSDVLVENFRPGTMEKLGLKYEDLSRANPGLIMISISFQGQTGPESSYKGYAVNFGPAAGAAHLTGYPDAPPVLLRSGADLRAGAAGALAVLLALFYRLRTGRGQYIDLSCREANMLPVGDLLMRYSMNGREPLRMGNRDSVMSPHNCYRCRPAPGDPEGWVSIAVSNEEEWRALCRAMGKPELAEDERFCDPARRYKNQEELDRIIEEWTSNFTPQEATRILQEAGVAAFPSCSNKDLFEDPHIKERKVFREVFHPKLGRQFVLGPPWRFSRAPEIELRPAPLLGADNDYVFGGLLGLSHEEIEDLRREGVID